VDFQFLAYHPVQRNRLATLDIREADWSETLNGGSVLSGKVTVPSDPYLASRIEQGTRPDEAAIYVQSAPGVLPWGGIVKGRSWDSDNDELTISVQEWRTYLYDLILGPDPAGTSSNSHSWVAKDQLQIARDILGYALADGAASGGVPAFSVGSEVSGVNRTYGLTGTDFKTVGAYLDEIGALDNGFEWDVDCYFGDDGLPTLRLVTYYPQRGGTVPGLLFKEGFNILSKGALELSSDSRATRVWAVGDGPNAESIPYAMDQDPNLVLGYELRTDASFNFTGVTRTTLASYARSQRTYLGSPVAQFTFLSSCDSPDMNTYAVGDRCRIILHDRFVSLDLSDVRIISREIKPDDQTVTITVDFNDAVPLEVDSGGAV
jgi:hypothetical protein